MLYDFIEPFRPWIDQVLIQLFISGKIIENQHYALNELGSIVLTSEGKKQIINRYYAFMDEKIYLGQKRIKRVDHIHYASQTLAQQLKNYRHDTPTDSL